MLSDRRVVVVAGAVGATVAVWAGLKWLSSRKKKKKASQVVVAITGFGKFKGVSSNPTQDVIKALPAHLRQNKLPASVVVDRTTVLEVSGEGCKESLLSIRDSCFQLQGQHRVWLHLGVDANATGFKLERKAWNDADFRCSDERGWQPRQQKIEPKDGGRTVAVESRLPVRGLVWRLRRAGFSVQPSTDPGRFVCNWLYYHSLRACQAQPEQDDEGEGEGAGGGGEDALFVHVPGFARADLEEQLRFVSELLAAIGDALT